MRCRRIALALLAGPLVAAFLDASPARAQSTTTTTTVPPFPTTTTLDVGTDVTGGGRFHGGFGPGGYDGYFFEITMPTVLLTETSNGADQCSGDTTMTLRYGGIVIASNDDSGPGKCSRLERRLLNPGEYEIRVQGYQGVAVSEYVLDVEFVDTDCGNDVLEPLEECDDGNLDDGDCCAADCTTEDDGSPCDDGLACDGADTCSGGACIVHELNPCPGIDGDSNCAESCSDAGGGCHFADPDGSACNDGLFCNGPDECVSGNCIVHAGDPCRGPDGDGRCNESCKESLDSCSAADPGFPPCDDGSFCNGTDTCLGGVCSQHTGNPCIGADGDGDCSESCSESKNNCKGPDPTGSACQDGLWCTGVDSCSGGTCSLHTGSGCPGPDGDANCVESCNEQAQNCTASDANGSACNDGVFCNGADKCSAGSCTTHVGNPCPGADGDTNCAESCNETGDTCTAADPNGSACNDALFCNGADSCTAGACTTHVGNPCPGADGDGNCAESCNETADACTAADPNGSACNDSLFCTGADSCSAGACSVHAGSGCTGADGDGNCSESCNEIADDCTGADSNGAPCNDGVFCNGADTCSGGTCSLHAGSPCTGPDGDGNCSESCDEAADTCTAPDTNGAACSDGVFCNGADTCSGGLCTGHAGDPCPGPDGDGNCSESCNEIGDVCTAADPNGASCADGLFCNGADTCNGGACSIHAGSPCTGADGDGNCTESCNEAGDSCTAADPDGSACNDGVFCNGADSCSSGACTLHAGDPCPGPDGDGNCSEACNEAADACTSADPDAAVCNDGAFCNGTDTCSGGLCSGHAGDPCVGADGDGNCSESCNETADNCASADPGGAACEDGLVCNGSDSCAGGFCTEHSGNQCPGADGDGDCSESCSDSGGGCGGNDPAGSPCDDGVFCNGADTCLNGSCSVHAGDPCPGADGDADCTETCSEAADACTAADGNGAACSDGLFCNGADTCSAGACSVHAGTPCPGPDGDGDCTETCDESADDCSGSDPNGTGCNDGVFCNGSDTCSGGQCTAHAGDPCPGADGDQDCTESCDEGSAECSGADPGGVGCDDGLFCNGADACSEGACSAHEGDPCTGADGDGDCSESCDEGGDACDAPDPDASTCDDGLYCNGDDACASGACAAHTNAPCPGPDGDDDCTESCEESADDCSAVDPEASPCDDGVFCNGADSCSGGACDVHPGDPCAGPDGDGDCSESCDEGAATCSGPDTDGTACSDDDACTLDDVCDGAGACVSGSAIPDCAGLCGDANGDDDISASDALLVLKAGVGGPQCNEAPCLCDVNANQAVSASDALLILRKAVGIALELTCNC